MNNEEERKDDSNLQYYRSGFDDCGWEAISMRRNRGRQKNVRNFQFEHSKVKGRGSKY